ncbi:TRAP transporter solute receptor TAXI family precursor [Paramagnetospirillum magnetotacticum MS-1]|uniref:TRAP transporter solute receptor TAXI family n=1 Tax=Paramagnetospirillum magnetotacticum MS-1 TaxID=272627 RepID=A0A0C2YYT4_PARME|nr:TAXI family TRAP transporter solute-binding subunit [Paramagnetospirillum magnetotacticum]KIL99830.1 TRAP transporter solute receptor TAXI family precursor [Paramagnetospirillum magnetotacticum MS-1]
MKRILIPALLAGLALAQAAGAAERRTLVIAGGEVTGYYFPVAGALCRVINKDHPLGLGCAVMPSSGSAANLAALKSGDADLALVQSRAAQMAFIGAEGFKESGPMSDLRAIMALHGEVAVVVARPGSGIETLGDLKGKRVNLGKPGSFQRSMAEMVIDASGLSQGDLSVLVELDLTEQAAELCQGNIDAAIFTGIHPMPEVQMAVEECGASLVQIRSKSMDSFFKKTPWAARFAVRGGTYDGQKEDVAAIGLKTLLVTTKLSAEEVGAVARTVWANFGAFTRLHPALRGLSKAESKSDGIPIRMHDGVEAAAAER